MVKSDNGKSVHDETQEYEDADTVDDIGLDSEGFDSNPKQVSGTQEVSVDKSGYGLRDRDYSHGDFGFFGPADEVFEVFSAVMDAPVKELEKKRRPVTDGGQDVYAGEEVYAGGGQPKIKDVDHEGPYEGAPW